MASTVWKGYISFGLVSFPVRLFSAARAETVHFHMLHKKDLSRVKEVWFCADEDKQRPPSPIRCSWRPSKNSEGVITTFDAPGAGQAAQQGTYPSGINNYDVITGYYIDSNSVAHGFVHAK